MAKETLSDILAKELGYKNARELKENINRRGGGDFASDVKGRLEMGQSISTSFVESAKDIVSDVKESKKRFGERAYTSFFSGDDIFSSYMRGLLRRKSPQKMSVDEVKKQQTIEKDQSVYLNIIAKNSLVLHMMARDVNVLRQNIVKLTKIETENYNKDKKKSKQIEAANRADAFFLREDERERKLESEKEKYSNKPKKMVVQKKEQPKEGILEKITSFLTNNFLNAIKTIFNFKNLLKYFAIGSLLNGLFQGIKDAWNKWKETGDFWSSLKDGFTSFISALSFGLFSKENVNDFLNKIGDFFGPILDTVQEIFSKIKNWIANNVGIPEIPLPESLRSIYSYISKEEAPESIGPFYPFKENFGRQKDLSRTDSSLGELGINTSEKQSPSNAGTDYAGIIRRYTGDGTGMSPTKEDKTTEYQDLKSQILNLKINYKKEKNDAISRLSADTGRFPEGINLDPSSNDYPSELKSIDEKYSKLISSKINEIRKIENLPQFKNVQKEENFEIEKLTSSPIKQSVPSEDLSKSSPVMSSTGTASSVTPSTTPSLGPIGGLGPTGDSSMPAASSPSLMKEEFNDETSNLNTSSLLSPETNNLEKLNPNTSTLGSQIDAISTKVAEEQRMESAAEEGALINAPVVNNQNSVSTAGKEKAASAYDIDFLKMYGIA